ncbi:hypothetical protein EYF80_052957 [Liparis tanakae]|uniref:Uncharacterized protein n=1 Tax=Liparis tanakae TaxID=230148 RepID=A0A4Z2F7K0_9TELE|nr:hypothetical protein EYF80_052957 [Liparis tanakae]
MPRCISLTSHSTFSRLTKHRGARTVSPASPELKMTVADPPEPGRGGATGGGGGGMGTEEESSLVRHGGGGGGGGGGAGYDPLDS